MHAIQYAEAVRAAVVAARAQECRVEIETQEPTRFAFALRWKAKE